MVPVAGGWRAQFSAWIRNTDPQAMLNSAIFFDFRPVFGDATLSDCLRTWLLDFTQATPRFLMQMAQGALSTRVPLGTIRDFLLDDGREFPHTIDLKLYGLRPFVDAARINALRFGVAHTNTAQRLRLTAPTMNLRADDVRAFVDAYYSSSCFVYAISSSTPMAIAHPASTRSTNEFDRRMFKESLRQARALQQRLALDYAQ